MRGDSVQNKQVELIYVRPLVSPSRKTRQAKPRTPRRHRSSRF
jgi:hypothetical protein